MQSTIKPNRIRSSSFQKVNTLMFNRKKDVWPSPESSIGKLCPANVSTSGSCWEAVGPARDAFEEVCEDVKLLFQAQCEYLYEGEERASTISYGIWMIGKDRPRAVPTIIIGCESKNVRTKAKDILKGSGLLDAFPGIVIKKTARTPGLLASQNQFSDESSPPGLETVYAFESASENDLCTIQIFLGGPEVPPDPATAPRATMGKFLLIDGKPHGLTVSHVFDSTIATPAAATAPSDGGNLMVFDEDSDSDSSSLADFTSKGSVTPPSIRAGSASSSFAKFLGRVRSMSGASDHSVENITAMVPYISLDPETSKELAPTSREPLVRIGNLVKRSHGIDWALVRLDSNAWYYRNKVRLDHKFGQPDFIYSGDPATEISDDDDIVICTARIGPIKGYISQTPAFIRAAKGGAFQKVWPVVTEQWLEEGDCGSWILNRSIGTVYGHLVAGSHKSALGYFAAADVVTSGIINGLTTATVMPTIVYPPTPLKLGKTPSTTEWRGKLMLELYVEDRDKIPKDCHIVATVQGNSVNIRFHDIIRSDRALGAEETFDIFSWPVYIDFLSYCNDPRVIEDHTRVECSLQTKPEYYKKVEATASTKPPFGILYSSFHDTTHLIDYGPADFQLLRLADSGDYKAQNSRFGHIFKVRKKDTNRIYAMRTVPLRGGGGILQAADVRTEIRAIHRVSSEFVCPVKFQYDTGTERHLISDYMPWPLFSYLQLERRFTEETTRFYISELILALGAFHERGLILGRLRPENIMLNAMGNLVISNFGLPLHKLPSLTDIEYDGITFGEYTPPEAIHNKESQLNRSYDFWTLGCFIFEMACGWSPFFAEDPAQMFANITSGKMLFPRGAMSKEGRDVIKGLLNRNPLHRLGSENGIMELMMHPWFSGTDWENFTKRYTETPIKPNLQSITSDHLEHQHVLEHEPHSTSTFGVSTFSSAQYSLDSGLGMSSRYNSMLSTPLSYDSALGMPSPLRKTRMKELVYVDNDEVEHRIDEEDEVERLLV